MLTDTGLLAIASVCVVLFAVIVGEVFDKRPGWPFAHTLAAIAAMLLLMAALNIVWVFG